MGRTPQKARIFRRPVAGQCPNCLFETDPLVDTQAHQHRWFGVADALKDRDRPDTKQLSLSGDIITPIPEEAAAPDPITTELIESVVQAGQDWTLGISQADQGHLRVISRGDRRLERPIEILFTAKELHTYYRRIADEAERGVAPEPPLEWWMTLMSTHLMEAVHGADRHNEPCVITVTATGFAATPATQAHV
ncbi:hypothetical protein ACL02S_00735 [Nocardia sp. 004]|uniref:hypothetical protein n=1 Tax=Nocardia sp. 004 TaxID=3385978 RepID=UPI0039A17D71